MTICLKLHQAIVFAEFIFKNKFQEKYRSTRWFVEQKENANEWMREKDLRQCKSF